MSQIPTGLNVKLQSVRKSKSLAMVDVTRVDTQLDLTDEAAFPQQSSHLSHQKAHTLMMVLPHYTFMMR